MARRWATLQTLLVLMICASAYFAHADERDPCHSASACAEAWLEALRLEHWQRWSLGRRAKEPLYSKTLEDKLVGFGRAGADELVRVLDRAMRGDTIVIYEVAYGLNEGDFRKILTRVEDHLYPEHAEVLLRAARLATNPTDEHRYLALVRRAGHPDWPAILADHLDRLRRIPVPGLVGSPHFGVEPIEDAFVAESIALLRSVTDPTRGYVRTRIEFLSKTRLSNHSMAALIAVAEDDRLSTQVRSLALSPLDSGVSRPVVFEKRLFALADRLKAELAVLPPIPEAAQHDPVLYDQWEEEIRRREDLLQLAYQAEWSAEWAWGPYSQQQGLHRIKDALQGGALNAQEQRRILAAADWLAFAGPYHWKEAQEFAYEIKDAHPKIAKALLAAFGTHEDAVWFRADIFNDADPRAQQKALLILGGLRDKASKPAIAALARDHWNIATREAAKQSLKLIDFGGTHSEEMARRQRKTASLAVDDYTSDIGPFPDAPICDPGRFWYRGAFVPLKPFHAAKPISAPEITQAPDDWVLEEDPNIVIPVEGGWLVSFDRGEWGGGLFFVDRQGRAESIGELYANARAERDLGAREEAYYLYGAVTVAYTHVGWVHRVRRVGPGSGAGAWTVERVGRFRGSPTAYRQLSDGTILVQTTYLTNFVMTRAGMHRGQCEQILTER